MPEYSIIIPVFNRPDELDELLCSLASQLARDFEVVVVEDGSTISALSVVERYAEQISIQYFSKDNSGPALSRNYGAERAKGRWFIFLDSDCVTPPDYLSKVTDHLVRTPCDAFGGPDRADSGFTATQKAINYSMTSFFTTGGIRGGGKSLEKFHPRSFNMGVSRVAFEAVGGFSAMRFGEDVDLSIRLFQAGFSCMLIGEGWVYHKRRVDFRKFFRQVKASGGARITLSRRHPHSLRLVHLLPALFTAFVAFSAVGAIFCAYALLPLAAYLLLILADASLKTKSIKIGVLAVGAAFIQLIGYGIGFFTALMGSNPEKIKNKKFYR